MNKRMEEKKVLKIKVAPSNVTLYKEILLNWRQKSSVVIKTLRYKVRLSQVLNPAALLPNWNSDPGDYSLQVLVFKPHWWSFRRIKGANTCFKVGAKQAMGVFTTSVHRLCAQDYMQQSSCRVIMSQHVLGFCSRKTLFGTLCCPYFIKKRTEEPAQIWEVHIAIWP
jgi:hypothetical protein